MGTGVSQIRGVGVSLVWGLLESELGLQVAFTLSVLLLVLQL